MNMKRRTPNTERGTSNAERVIRWIGGRVKEDAPVYGTTHRSDSTPNTERPTPKERRIRTSTWKIDCLNSAHGLFDWLMLSRIGGRLIILPAKFSLAGLLQLAITAK